MNKLHEQIAADLEKVERDERDAEAAAEAEAEAEAAKVVDKKIPMEKLYEQIAEAEAEAEAKAEADKDEAKADPDDLDEQIMYYQEKIISSQYGREEEGLDRTRLLKYAKYLKILDADSLTNIDLAMGIGSKMGFLSTGAVINNPMITRKSINDINLVDVGDFYVQNILRIVYIPRRGQTLYTTSGIDKDGLSVKGSKVSYFDQIKKVLKLSVNKGI